MRLGQAHFTTYRRWRGLEPLIVGASGNLWLTGGHGHPLVFSPSTGRTYKLREHGGQLFQSPDGQISYVWSPFPAQLRFFDAELDDGRCCWTWLQRSHNPLVAGSNPAGPTSFLA